MEGTARALAAALVMPLLTTFALEAEVTSSRQFSEMAYPIDGKNVIFVTVPGVSIPEELLRDLRPGFSGRAKVAGRTCAWGLIPDSLRP